MKKNHKQKRRTRSARLVKLMNTFLALNFYFEYLNYKKCIGSKLAREKIDKIVDNINTTQEAINVSQEDVSDILEHSATSAMNSLELYRKLLRKIDDFPALSSTTIHKLVILLTNKGPNHMPQLDLYSLNYFYYCVYFYQYVNKIMSKKALRKILKEQSTIVYNMSLFRQTCVYLEKLYDDINNQSIKS